MFILDDIALRSLGISLPIPFDTLAVLETVQDFALKELYNPEKINNRLKEVSLLLADGKITKEEFEREKKELILKLGIAEKVRENIEKRNKKDIRLV